MLNLELSGIKKIEAIAQSSPEYISLSQGALRVGGIPQQIKQHLQEALNTDKTDYYQSAWGIAELRKKLSKVLSKDTTSPKLRSTNKKEIPVNQIIITHGCIGALSTLLFTVLDQGDEIIIPEPTYPAYEKLAHLVRAKPVFVSCASFDSASKMPPSSLRQGFVGQAGRTGEEINNFPSKDQKVQPLLTHKTCPSEMNKHGECCVEQNIYPSPVRPACPTKPWRRLEGGILNAESKDNQWELNVEKIKQATTEKTKIIIFSNPWNPLGIIVPEKTILELKSWCEEKKIYLVIDEAYKDYAFDENYKSYASLVSDSQYVITTASFSKNMAMSGWRIGYMIVPPELCQRLGTTQDALLNCPNVPAQYAALYALDHPEFTKEFHDIVKSNLQLAEKMLAPLVEKKILTYQKSKGSFFLFLKVDFDDATDLCMSILSKAKVALIPGKFFGKSGESFLRLCYARDREVLREGLERLVKYFL